MASEGYRGYLIYTLNILCVWHLGFTSKLAKRMYGKRAILALW